MKYLPIILLTFISCVRDIKPVSDESNINNVGSSELVHYIYLDLNSPNFAHADKTCPSINNNSRLVILNPDSVFSHKKDISPCHYCIRNFIYFDSIYNKWHANLVIENEYPSQKSVGRHKSSSFSERSVIPNSRSPLEDSIPFFD